MVTSKQIINNLKKKIFSISYEDAIDIQEIMSVNYVWVYSVSGDNILTQIILNDFNVRLYIKEW